MHKKFHKNNAEIVGKAVCGIDYVRREMELPLKIFVEAVQHSKKYGIPAKKVAIIREAIGETLLRILIPSNFEASLEEITKETSISVKDFKEIKRNYYAYQLPLGVLSYLEKNIPKSH